MKVFTFRETETDYEILVFNRLFDFLPKSPSLSVTDAVMQLQERVKRYADEAAAVMLEEYIKTVPHVIWYGKCPWCGTLYTHDSTAKEKPNATFAPCHKGPGLRPVINWSREIPE